MIDKIIVELDKTIYLDQEEATELRARRIKQLITGMTKEKIAKRFETSKNKYTATIIPEIIRKMHIS